MLETVQIPKFAWSYSRLKAFEDCGRRFYEVDVLKKWPKDESPNLKWGNDVHAALAAALRGTPLPTTFKIFEPWIDKVNRTPGELIVEDDARLACTREFTPTTWMSDRVWLRTVADVIKLDGDVALICDWKAGRSANVDPIQGVISSLMAFVHFPELQCVRFDFIWLQEDTQTTQLLLRSEAADQWAEIMPRVKKLEQAHIDEHFPPKPNRFCARWCSVKSCEYHGR